MNNRVSSKLKNGQNKLIRSSGKKKIRKIFFIATEGKTERNYFKWIERLVSLNGGIEFIPRQHSAPDYLLKAMKQHLHLTKGSFKKNDEACIVMDRDTWPDKALDKIDSWSNEKANYYFALSNPMFEYWLLLHFAENPVIASQKDCLEQLKKYWPNYNKLIVQDCKELTLESAKEAMRRAKMSRKPHRDGWPRDIGQTDVHKLVERIILAGEKIE